MHVAVVVQAVSVHLLHQYVPQAKSGVNPQNLAVPHHA